MNRTHAILAATLLAATSATAQVVFNTVGGTYSQNFSSLSTSTSIAQTWTQNSTITGWYARNANSDFSSYTPQWETGVSTGVLYHLRNTTQTNTSFLGGRVTSTTGNITLGLRLTNNTGDTLTSFDLSFLASTFYKTGVAQQQQVAFSTDATSLNSGTWTTIPALTYTVPYTTSNAPVSAAEEISSRQALSITGQNVVWANGQDLWIR
jgi:hypothetical protein